MSAPLKALYTPDVEQLRQLYKDSTARDDDVKPQKTAWTTPRGPTSARTTGQTPRDKATLQLDLAKVAGGAAPAKPVSARQPNSARFASFVPPVPLSARAGVVAEAPLQSAPKAPQQPASARPVATPRQKPAEAQAKPAAATPAAGEAALGPIIPPAGSVFEHDGGSSVVLPVTTAPPSEKEVKDYAVWLSIDPETEPELLWLASEALVAPLPPYWRPCQTNDGEVYYFNFSTGESLWDHPMDELFKKLAPTERERLQEGRAKGEPYQASAAYIQATIGAFLAHLCPAAAGGDAPTDYGSTDLSGVKIPEAGTVFMYEEGGGSTVLADNVDNFVPSEQDVTDYAQWLGIDPATEQHLLWIAREGLTTPLPEAWRPCKTESGDLYYFNFATGESLWDHPMDEFFKKLVVLERANGKK